MQVVTLATMESLPRARALGRSLLRHQPDWHLDVVLVADTDVVSAADHEGSLSVRSVSQDLDLDIETLLARYNERDLGTLLMPRLLERYAERTSEPVLHLPSCLL